VKSGCALSYPSLIACHSQYFHILVFWFFGSLVFCKAGIPDCEEKQKSKKTRITGFFQVFLPYRYLAFWFSGFQDICLSAFRVFWFSRAPEYQITSDSERGKLRTGEGSPSSVTSGLPDGRRIACGYQTA
jgi:hypothetical protein